jgi:hypothetical protein
MSRFAPSLQHILFRLVNQGVQDLSERSDDDERPGRFPVVVKPETRRFLEAQASALGSSMAGVAGAILDGVALSTLHGDDGQYSMQAISDRLTLLLHEHQLSFPAAAQVLKPLGLGLEELSDRQKMKVSLTSERLADLAEMFHVEYDWLCGKGASPGAQRGFDWYKHPIGAIESILKAHREFPEIELCLICSRGTDFSVHDDDLPHRRLPHLLPFLIRRRDLAGGETLEIFESGLEGRWSYWNCRRDLKVLIHFADQASRRNSHIRLTGRYVSSEEYSRLRDGKILAASVLAGSRRCDWYPELFVGQNGGDSKESKDWESMQQNDEMRATLRHVDRLLQQLDKGQ